MVEKINLKQIERNVFRDYCQDGLVDIMFGAYFLFVGLLLPAGPVAPFIVTGMDPGTILEIEKIDGIGDFKGMEQRQSAPVSMGAAVPLDG